MESKLIKTNKQIVSYSIGNIALNNYLKLTTNKTNKAESKINPPVVTYIPLKKESGFKNSLKSFIYSIHRVKKEVLKKWWNILKRRKWF